MHSSPVSHTLPRGDLDFDPSGDTSGEGRHSKFALDRG